MRSKTLAAGLLIVGFLLTGCSSVSGGAPISGDAPDSIEQARVVLGGGHTYDEVQVATDAALQSAGESLTDSNRGSAWSSILKVEKGLVEKGYPAPDSMTVMKCIPGSIANRGVSLTEAVAYCSLEIAGIPESEW